MKPGPDRVHLVDTTLRDGAQGARTWLSGPRRAALARAILAAGFAEVEAGIPAMGAEELAAIGAVLAVAPRERVSVWCRCREDDVAAALASGAGIIHLAVPASPGQEKSTRIPWNDLLQRRLPRLAARVLDAGAALSVGAVDASRCPGERLLDLARTCWRLGVLRLRLADSAGVWDPWRAAEAVQAVHGAAPGLGIGIHAHDDLGLATAVTLAALRAGARWADVTVLGIGERAGNAASEQVVMAAAVQGWETAVAPRALTGLARQAAEAFGCAIPERAPVVGAAALRHGAGIHVAAASTGDPLAFQAFPAARVGADASVDLVSAYSGSTAVAAAVARTGAECPRERARRALAAVRRAAWAGPLSDHEVAALVLGRSGP